MTTFRQLQNPRPAVSGPVATAADALLELSIVGSFSSIGFEARRRLFAWEDPRPEALRGRTILITGPTSGLGRAAADALAGLGARLVLLGRSADRLAGVRAELAERHGEDRFATVVADMRSLGSVHDAVNRILATEQRLDALIDNAGAIYPERTLSPDGIESTLATLVVGPFALTGGLVPLLAATPESRVIAVTSGGQYAQRLRLDDLHFTFDAYSGSRAYARAKRAQVVLVREWARRLAGTGVRVNAMHPGWADTPGLVEALPAFHRVMRPILRTPAQGIDTLVWLAADPEAGARGGQLFLDRRPRPFDRAPATRVDPLDRRRLWDRVVELSGAPDPVTDPRPPTHPSPRGIA